MAETAVGLLVDKLIPLLTNEADLLRGVHEEVEGIALELEYIQAFVKDADRRADAEGDKFNPGVKLWVDELRGVTFKIEDAIDEYTDHFAARQQDQRLSGRSCIEFLLRVFASCILGLKPRHEIATKIRDLKQAIGDVKRRGEEYGFKDTQRGSTISFEPRNNAWYDPRKDSRFLKEAEVVGIESARDELIGVLEGGSHRRTVVSVVGMGGIGKTTLSHQVYNRVKGRFDCHAWTEVSQSYDTMELLRNLLSNLCRSREESVPQEVYAINDSVELTMRLRDYLEGNRYFIVFDDVWDVSFWAQVRNALPDDNHGKIGRVLITTRLLKVADFCKTSAFVFTHHLQPLPREKAWELFCNKAFGYEFEGHCPSHLEEFSREIVERCDGLPLAIIVIAGLLSTKNKTVYEWRKLLASLSSELESNEHLASTTRILSLSYYDLSHHLKSCFLYFGIFPEDYSIRYRRLIRLWIAEGFVKPQKDKTLEVVAEEYLIELINRNVVQISARDFDGKPISCRIHDLLREVVLKKMEDLNFCSVLSRKDSNFTRSTRRVSVLQSSHNGFESVAREIPNARSIFFFEKDETHNLVVSTIAANSKLLKVLDFEDSPSLVHLPKDIGYLFHLRYISLRGTRVTLLPKTIGELASLETLDLKHSLVDELPLEINRLRKLRHLLAYHIDYKVHFHINRQSGIKVKKGIGQLKALQKLFLIEANSVGFDVLNELSELKELKKLGIKNVRTEDGTRLCSCIQELEHLESLVVSSIAEDETIALESMSPPPRFLQRLFLKGRLRNLPEWITKLQSLVRIQMCWSKLEDDPLKALQNLHNLLELSIYKDAYYGEKLHFEEGSFPKLRVLQLRWLSRLNSLVIKEGALRNLEQFIIGPCSQLEEVPSGFHHLINLRLFRFIEMPTGFLMIKNFQCLPSAADVQLFCKIYGKLSLLPLESVFELQKYMQEHDEVDWNSLPFEDILGKVFVDDHDVSSEDDR